ncbi:SNF2 family N-terminal domain-containing protein [Russula brevipes]|nr:SNF2 family N-terminal domain-containing protein [Russula brevipes]
MYHKGRFPFGGAAQPAAHHIEYSKSSRAKCRGKLCGGSLIRQGELRYGHTVESDYGEIVQWKHWGCLTPQILGNISSYGVQRVAGFSGLSQEDQARVRLAIKKKRVDPTDLTGAASASSQVAAAQPPAQNPRKRKAEAVPGPSRVQNVAAPSPTQAAARQAAVGGTAWEEGADAEEVADEQVEELFCTASSNVVGIQYYKGLVDAGEQVRLIREPNNRYDRNAIAVQNIGRMQVGHIPRQMAAKLAPAIDAGLITVEGTMNEGNCSSLKIYGVADKRDQIEPMLRGVMGPQIGLHVRPYEAAASYTSGYDPRSYGHGTQATSAQSSEALRKQQEEFARAAELRQMLANLEKVDDEGRRGSLLDTLCSTEDILNLPEHPSPPGIASGELRVDLLKHQKQALQWAIEHENPKLPTKVEDKPVQFWQYQKTASKAYYYNIVTKTPQEAPPVLGRGALCGDSMGLGKTLTMIALILATKNEVSSEYSKSTLIVVPLSVLSNWEKQIRDHCMPDTLSHVVYYGATRHMSATELQKYDVVVTTYQTVAGEHSGSDEVAGKRRKKASGSLFGSSGRCPFSPPAHWQRSVSVLTRSQRIVLDEGHNIRNSRTKMAQSVCALIAQRRWVLTGTPIINSPQDLGSILTFLRIWAIMSQICIRRTKEMQDSNGNPLIPLPGVEMTVVPVTLDSGARELYDTVEQLSKERIEGFLRESVNLSSLAFSTNALSMLTRLRQLVLHPGLIPSDYVDQLRSLDEAKDDHRIQVTPQEKARLQGLLLQAIEDNEECPVCFGVLDDPRITACSHRFCLACIMEVLTRDNRCPMDRRVLGIGDLIEPPPPTELTQAPILNDDENEAIHLHRPTLHLLRLTPENEKSLVFSQFTTFLDKIADVLDKEGIPYVRFDGKMSAKRRQETLETFCVPIEHNAQEIAIDPAKGKGNVGEYQQDVISINSGDDEDFMPQMDNDSKAASRSYPGSVEDSDVNTSPNRDGVNPKIMLISLKAGALGLNLTVANNIYLWWQEGIESQAIDRCNRIGQTKAVHVYQLIAENTVEAKVLEIQDKKKKLIKEAFSGMKSRETPRQKKEARLQELVELFGVRRQSAGPACQAA